MEKPEEEILNEFRIVPVDDAKIMKKQEEEILNEFRRATVELQNVWDKIGFDEKECKTRKSKISVLVKDCLREIVDGEHKLKKTYDRRIQDSCKELYELNKALNANLPDPSESMVLIELDRYLRHHVEILRKEVKIRRDKVKELKRQEKELCDCMCEEPDSEDREKIPSNDDIKDLERRIRTLKQEKVNRQKTFRRLKDVLQQLMIELEQPNKTPFEITVLSDVEELFTLSHTNLERLKRLVSDYELKVHENEKECLELQERVRVLYNRLEVDPSERDTFLASIVGHTPSMLAKLHEEWQRLEGLKRENLALLINQQRRQIENLWDQCFISEHERNSFEPYLYDEYTEESLEAHDKEVQKLEAYFQEWKNIFVNIKRRDQLWQKFIQLEEKANDPNRLKSNRGGALLQEEKERNKVKNELPRVEKELEQMVALWEKELERPFLVHGKRLEDYILDQWHHHYMQKEQEKGKKQSGHSKNTQNYTSLQSTRSHSVKRNQSMKRRLPRNETHRMHKLRRIGEESASEGSFLAQTPTRGSSSVLRERNQNTIPSQLGSASKGSVSTISSDVESYTTFMKRLHPVGENKNVRSPAVLGQSRTPKPSSSHRPPPGLPKTLPRAATRRSPRLHSGQLRSPRNILTPGQSRNISYLTSGQSRNISYLTPGQSRNISHLTPGQSRNISRLTPGSQRSSKKSSHQTTGIRQSSRNISHLSPAPSTSHFKSPSNSRLKTPDRWTKLFLI